MSNDYKVCEENYKGFEIKVYQDCDYDYQTAFDDEGGLSICCLHNKEYALPNNSGIDFKDYSSWLKIAEYLKNEKQASIILNVRGYQHSGLTISVSESYPYNDRWDSGQAGLIYTTDEKIKECYGVKRITKKVREKAKQSLINYIKYIDDILTGNIYGYCIELNGEEIDSCWGFVGDYKLCLQEARAEVDVKEVKSCIDCGKQVLKSEIQKYEGKQYCSICSSKIV